ncbi:MAG TPA: TetR/AcrR family transcriptional regulator [Fibrobacteria bacterium]|nr:TetR/AcrR family transcriptional regulator [Fibrobacteria bacterium]HOX51146.1 TetR/AcrR family transcriptional regulator [Fibrobacteria bacterium]
MRKKEGDKSNEILNAATQVFARDGFDKAQVAAISTAAGVGTGSIYLYFTGKADILRALFSRFWDHLAKEMANLETSDPLLRLNDQLGLFFDRLAVNRDFARTYLRDHHRFLEFADLESKQGYLSCVEQGRNAFLEIAASHNAHETPPGNESTDLSQSILFGGVRASLEHLLTSELPAARVRSRMLTMAMAGILAATRENEP